MDIIGDLQEAWGDFMLSMIIGLALWSWGSIESAFTFTDIASEENAGMWQAIVGGTLVYTDADSGGTVEAVDHPGLLNIVTAAMIPIFIIFVSLQLLTSVIRKSSAGFIRACVMAVAAIPGIYIAAGLMWMALTATNGLSQWILSVGVGDDIGDGPRAIMGLFGLQFGSEGTDEAVTVDEDTGLIMDENFVHWGTLRQDPSDIGMAVVAVLVAVLMWISSLLLQLMMMFRLICLLVLACFISVAVFSVAWDAARPIGVKWMQIVIALLIAEPAAAVIIRLGGAVAMFGSDWVRIGIGIVILLVAAIMPIFTMTLVSFMTGGASDSIDRAGAAGGANVGRQVSRTTSAIRHRTTPAGAATKMGRR